MSVFREAQSARPIALIIQDTRRAGLRASLKADIYSVTTKGTKIFQNLSIFFVYFVIFVV
jgi:hypothetical protein